MASINEILVGSGVASVIGAVVGGGLEAAGVKLPLVSNLRRQALLFAVGAALIGLGLFLPGEPRTGTASGTTASPPETTPTTSAKADKEEPVQTLKAPPGRYVRGEVCPDGVCRVKNIDWRLPEALQPDPKSKDGSLEWFDELRCFIETQNSVEDVLDFLQPNERRIYLVGGCLSKHDRRDRTLTRVELMLTGKYSDAYQRQCATFTLRYVDYETVPQSLSACLDKRGWVGPLTEPPG